MIWLLVKKGHSVSSIDSYVTDYVYYENLMKRVLIIIVSGVVLVVMTAWSFSYVSVRQGVLDFWEVSTGQYVVEHDTLNGVDKHIGVTGNLLDQAVSLDVAAKKKLEEARRMIEARHDGSWCSSKEECHLIGDPWVAEATGYLSVRTEDCPSWEACKKEKVASFIVMETESQELPSYFNNRPDSTTSVMLGCDDGSRLRFIAFEDMKSLTYQYFSGDGLQQLRKSSPKNPVRLRIEKPLRPYGNPATEGLVCMTPFSKYEVVDTEKN